jgi:hypothetical protein
MFENEHQHQRSAEGGSNLPPITEEEKGKLPLPPVFDMYASGMGSAGSGNDMGGAGKGVTVMEIDPSASPEVQEAERKQAEMLGIPIVMKGSAPGGAAKPVADDANEHPLARIARGGESPIKAELPPPPQHVVDYFKAAGIENAEDIIKQVPTLGVKMAELQSRLSDAQAQSQVFDGLSQDLRNLITMELSGEDWKQKVSAIASIDYSKPFSRQKVENLFDRYSKVKFTEDDWKEYNSDDCDPRLKRMMDAAVDDVKEAYEKDRDNWNNLEKSATERGQKMQTQFDDSRRRALSMLDSIPGSAAHRDRIAKALTLDGIRSFFFEKDGVTLKPESGLSAWLLMDKDKIFGLQTDALKGQAQSEATKGLLRRMDERPAPGGKGGGDQRGLSAEQIALATFKRAMGQL